MFQSTLRKTHFVSKWKNLFRENSFCEQRQKTQLVKARRDDEDDKEKEVDPKSSFKKSLKIEYVVV